MVAASSGRPDAGSSGDRPARVQVATDPSSPAVGVNLPAMSQTVTFAPGQNLASVTIPTNAGASNPGEVDVNLTITPIDPPPGPTVPGPLELRIIAPDAKTPPRIIGVAGTPDGIKLTFSKPMNPVQASNVHNYAVTASVSSIHANSSFLAAASSFIFMPSPIGGTRISSFTKSVPLRSANYDPADFTVTLIPKRRLAYEGGGSFVVTPGSPTKTSAPLRHGSIPAKGLTDSEGNAINQHGSPGKFRIVVGPGYTPVG